MFNVHATGKEEGVHHRRRIKTEEKAKVVAAALAILHQDDLKNRMNSTMQDDMKSSLSFKSSWCKTAIAAIDANSSYDLCLLFCINPS